jgi:MFS family permease
MTDRRAPGAWFALAVLTLANVSGFVDRQVLSLLVEPIRRDLGLTDTQVSLLMGLGFVVVSSTLALPLGRVADTRSRRALLAAGAAVWGVATTLTGAARSYAQLLVARMTVGAGEAALQPGAISLLADLFPPAQLGRAMAVYTLGTFLGSGVAYVLGAWGIAFAAEHLTTWPVLGAVRPWQSVYLLVGLLGLVVVPLLLLVREPPRRTAGAVPVRDVAAYLRRHARAVVPLTLGFACSAAVNYGIAGWLATFFVRTHGWSASRAGVLQGTLTMTVGVVGALGGGWLSDALRRRGRADGPLLVGVIGAAGMLLCAGSYPLVGSATLAAALLVPVNLFAALPWGPASAAMAEIMPDRMRGQGAALMLLVVNLVSGTLGPTAVALATDRLFGGPAGLRWALALTTVVGMSLAAALLSLARAPFRRTVEARATPDARDVPHVVPA